MPRKPPPRTQKEINAGFELRITRLERDRAKDQLETYKLFQILNEKIGEVNLFRQAAEAILSYFPKLAEGQIPSQTPLGRLYAAELEKERSEKESK